MPEIYVPKQIAVEYPLHVKLHTVRDTWRAWCAAAAAFGADLPSALDRDAIAEDYITYSDAVSAITRAVVEAVARTQLEDGVDTVVRANIEMRVSPDETTIAFGSGRSGACLRLYCETDPQDGSTIAGARIDVGCWAAVVPSQREVDDCMSSMLTRCRAAWDTLS